MLGISEAFNVALWALVLLAGLALEAMGVVKSEREGWHTLSYYIRKYVPVALIAAALLWLAQHFDVILGALARG